MTVTVAVTVTAPGGVNEAAAVRGARQNECLMRTNVWWFAKGSCLVSSLVGVAK